MNRAALATDANPDVAAPEGIADTFLPQLVVFRLRSLLGADGRMRATAPMLVASARRHLRLRCGFGNLASGPVSALHVPPRFELGVDEVGHLDDAIGLALAWPALQPPPRRREVLPERVRIPLAMFDALAQLSTQRSRVLCPRADPLAAQLVPWLIETSQERRDRCQGHQSARVALRDWCETIAAVEDEIVAQAVAPEPVPFRMPDVLRDLRVFRRFSRVLGCGPLQFAREFRRRTACAARSAAQIDAVAQAASVVAEPVRGTSIVARRGSASAPSRD